MLHTALNVKRNGFAKQYSYDKADNRETFLAKAGAATIQSVSYAYDNQKRLYQVKENNALVGTYGYDANGNRSSLTLANGVITSYAYNKANWLTELTNAKGGATLSSYAYSYYADGNQRTKTDNNNRVSSYVYDGVGRLKSETESSGLGLAYAYDRWGNRKTLTATGAQAYGVAYDYDANNRLSAETKTVGADVVTTAYVYDANGNQKSWMRETLSPLGQGQGALSLSGAGAAFYEHDAFNRMTLAYVDGVTTNYAYRVDGLRNSKGTSAATLAHLWDGANIAANMSGGSLIASYVRGVNLLRADAPAGQSYYLYNGHGDVTGLANASGVLTWAYDYDAFGVEREIVGQNPSTDVNPFRYSGEYKDLETNTYYLRNRSYQPTTGRFLSEDPIRAGLNWYTYCGNNPVMFWDPLGLERIVISGGRYSTGSGFQYEFIETAIKQLYSWAYTLSSESITWIIADEGWSNRDRRIFSNVAVAVGANILFINHTDQLIDYINYKNGINRADDPITNFVAFSHGFLSDDGIVSLGYNYSENYNQDLDFGKSDFERINASAFKNPTSVFWSCNTGTSGTTSFAQAWVNMVGGTTTAFVGKTDYTFINVDVPTWVRALKWADRKMYGFSPTGSYHFPIAGQNAYSQVFTP